MVFTDLLRARLKKRFFERETITVAQDLIGKLIVLKHQDTLLVGMIVETEGYRSDDEASHTFRGKTVRNSAMFGPVGHAYVYLIHGIHYGFNVVARDSSVIAGGVLIRAVEPLWGVAVMARRRGIENTLDKKITNGPGKLTQAFGIDMRYKHHNFLTPSTFFIANNILHPDLPYDIQRSERIGISKSQSHLWRFFIKGNRYVSPFKLKKVQ